jgi:hypothetical protein
MQMDDATREMFLNLNHGWQRVPTAWNGSGDPPEGGGREGGKKSETERIKGRSGESE